MQVVTQLDNQNLNKTKYDSLNFMVHGPISIKQCSPMSQEILIVEIKQLYDHPDGLVQDIPVH